MQIGYCIQLVLLYIWRLIHSHICPGKNPQTSFPPDTSDWVLSSSLGCFQANQAFSLILQAAPSWSPLVPPTLGKLWNPSLLNSWLPFPEPIYLAHCGQLPLGVFNGVGWPGKGRLQKLLLQEKEMCNSPYTVIWGVVRGQWGEVVVPLFHVKLCRPGKSLAHFGEYICLQHPLTKRVNYTLLWYFVAWVS